MALNYHVQGYDASRNMLMNSALIPPDRVAYPKVANVVTTWKVVEQDASRRKKKRRRRKTRESNANDEGRAADEYTLDLHSFARFNPTCKLNTSNFAAVICRACDDTTSLLFGSGSGVTVFARSPSLGVYACRVYTHIMGRTPMLMMPEGSKVEGWKPGTGHLPAKPVLTTLEGRLMFNDCFRENIVAYGYLGCRISLETIYLVHPEKVRYEPGNFPGLEWRATVIDPATKAEKMVKNLIFETGMWLIIGAQDMSVVNEVYWRLRKVATEFRNVDAAQLENERHEARLGKLMNKLYEPYIATGDEEEVRSLLPSAVPRTMEDMMNSVKTQLAENEAEMRAKEARKNAKKRRKKRRELGLDTEEQLVAEETRKKEERRQQEERDKYSLLMVAASHGNTKHVRMLLQMGEDPSYVNAKGETVLDLLEGAEGAAYTEIRKMLLQSLVPEHLHEEAIGISNL
jgi:TATA-box binding protein (TBP) (component of TFIID and TFIIIB)